MSFSKRCQAAIRRALAIEPLNFYTPLPPDAVRLVNFVTSVAILPPNLTLSMKNVILHSAGAAKFTPKKFHAIVLRIGCTIGNTTALLFELGKLVIVGAINKEHARFASQIFRFHIEQIHSIEGRTCFDGFHMYNIVAGSALGFRPDLVRLQKLYPEAALWEPEHFPGLRLQVWISPASECRCVKKKHKQNNSCACNAMCLFFDTGNMVVTGLHNEENASLVCDCIRDYFAAKPAMHDHTVQVPRHLRTDDRKLKKFSQFQVDFLGVQKPNETAKQVVETTSKMTALPKKREKADLSPIFMAIDEGQVEMVIFALEIDKGNVGLLDDEGRTPLERCKAQRADYSLEVYEQLIHVLLKAQGD